MINLIKPILFATSLISGSGLFAYALDVQKEQSAIQGVSLEPSPTGVLVVPPPRAVKISEPAPPTVEPAALEIEPVVIQAPAKYRAKPAVLPAKTEEAATSPCSGWRELGPQFVTGDKLTGTHQVRQLCD